MCVMYICGRLIGLVEDKAIHLGHVAELEQVLPDGRCGGDVCQVPGQTSGRPREANIC